jgi:hypothetical protein
MRRMIVRLIENTCVRNMLGTGLGLGCLILVTLISVNVVHGADGKSWLLTCEKDSDCTSVERGCWRWQPVSRKFKYIETAKKAFDSCMQSVAPGPQPPPRCVDHQCVNGPYTVKSWMDFQGSFQERKVMIGQPVSDRVESCLTAARIEKDWMQEIRLREPYFQKIDEAIRGQRFPEEEPLERVAESLIACDELVSKARSIQKK